MQQLKNKHKKNTINLFVQRHHEVYVHTTSDLLRNNISGVLLEFSLSTNPKSIVLT